MRALEFIPGHVTFKLRYNQIYQMKTTHYATEGHNSVSRWSPVEGARHAQQ
jgi:hypothetical protein